MAGKKKHTPAEWKYQQAMDAYNAKAQDVAMMKQLWPIITQYNDLLLKGDKSIDWGTGSYGPIKHSPNPGDELFTQQALELRKALPREIADKFMPNQRYSATDTGGMVVYSLGRSKNETEKYQKPFLDAEAKAKLPLLEAKIEVLKEKMNQANRNTSGNDADLARRGTQLMRDMQEGRKKTLSPNDMGVIRKLKKLQQSNAERYQTVMGLAQVNPNEYRMKHKTALDQAQQELAEYKEKMAQPEHIPGQVKKIGYVAKGSPEERKAVAQKRKEAAEQKMADKLSYDLATRMQFGPQIGDSPEMIAAIEKERKKEESSDFYGGSESFGESSGGEDY